MQWIIWTSWCSALSRNVDCVLFSFLLFVYCDLLSSRLADIWSSVWTCTISWSIHQFFCIVSFCFTPTKWCILRYMCKTALPTGRSLLAFILVIWYTHYLFLVCCWNRLFVQVFLVVEFLHCATKSVSWKNKGNNQSPKSCPSEAMLPHANNRGPYC
jgi:hypothetical protein